MFFIHKFGNESFVYLIFGVGLVILLFYYIYHWKINKMSEFAHVESAKKIFDSVSKNKRIMKYALLCIVYILFCLSIMRPQGYSDDLPDENEDENKKEINLDLSKSSKKEEDNQKIKVKEAARDIVFLLDVSGSMGAEDLLPNRLEKAKDYITDIVDELDGEHVGLVVFTSVPSVKCVLTLDYTYFKQVLKSVVVNDNDYAGTKFLPALNEIINKQFDYSDNKNKELIIITDGGDTDLEALKGDAKIQFEENLIELVKTGFETNKIRIHTIGLGTVVGSIVPGVKDESGEYYKSSLNDSLLKNISKNAGGIYLGAEDGDPDMKAYYKKYIGKATDELKEKEINVDKKLLNDLVQKKRTEEDRKVIYKEFYWIPTGLAALLLIFEYLISERKKKVVV